MRDPARQHAERFELLGLREVQRELLPNVGDLLGLRLLELRDLALLCPLGAQVGEGEARELVAVDVERRGADQDGHEVTVVVDELEFERRVSAPSSSRSSTPKPSSFGIARSSTSTSGGRTAIIASASRPSAASRSSPPSRASVSIDEPAQRDVVVDDEHGGALGRELAGDGLAQLVAREGLGEELGRAQRAAVLRPFSPVQTITGTCAVSGFALSWTSTCQPSSAPGR